MPEQRSIPEENEIVLCTVTKIQHHSVFCTLDEYGARTGMLHISEISAGRVKNITEYVREGKTIVCKVLRVDEAKGFIDLSLRRVTEAQKKQKAASIKKHQAAMKIIEAGIVGEKQGEKDKAGDRKKAEAIWDEINEKKGDYETVFDLFQGVVETGAQIPITDKATKDLVTKAVTDRLKPASVTIRGQLEITTYEPDGVEKIRAAFAAAKAVDAAYLGGGKYGITVVAKDYKKAETVLKTDLDLIEKALAKKAAKFAFARTDR
jgi:translation initiation factor 2 subunit 1